MIHSQTAAQYHKELCKVILAFLTCMSIRLEFVYGTHLGSTVKDRRGTCSEVRLTIFSKCEYLLSPMLRAAKIKCKTVQTAQRKEEKKNTYFAHTSSHRTNEPALYATAKTPPHSVLCEGEFHMKNARCHYPPPPGTQETSNEILCTLWCITEGRKSNWQSIQKTGTKHESEKRFKDT